MTLGAFILEPDSPALDFGELQPVRFLNTQPGQNGNWGNFFILHYDFRNNVPDLPLDNSISFQLGTHSDQIINFQLLNREELRRTGFNTDFTVNTVSEFLRCLGNHWTRFLTHEVGVPREHLVEFICYDLKETVLNHLSTPRTIEPDHFDTMIEDRLFRRFPDLRVFASRLPDQQRRDRIISLCCEQYRRLVDYQDEVQTKDCLLTTIGIHNQQTALLPRIYTELARMMMYIQSQKLKNMMKLAYQNDEYELRHLVGNMSSQLQRVLIRPTGIAEVEPDNLD